MRYWAAIAGIVLVAFIVLEIVAVEGFRPDPLSQHDFGSMYFESGARKNAMPNEVAGRASESKKIAESQLGPFQNELFVWVADQLAEEKESNGWSQPYDAELSLGQKTHKGLLIKVSSNKTTRIYVGMLVARARLMELAGQPAVDKGPSNWLQNGVAYYVADPGLENLQKVLDYYFDGDRTAGEELAAAFAVEDLRGVVIAIHLHKGKGWTFERIVKASPEEISKELGARAADPSDYYWPHDGWRSAQELLR